MFALSIGAAPAEFRAAALAIRQADKTIRTQVNNSMRETFNPVWKEMIASKARGGMESRMLTPGTRLAAGNPPALVAASSSRKIGRAGENRLSPNRHAAGWEFGADRGAYSDINRKGTRFEARRQKHLPPRIRGGRVVHPSAGKLLPRIASYWVQSVVRAFMTAAEGDD